MDSQQYCSQNGSKATKEEEWQIVPSNWWHTPFTAISWTYEPAKTSQNLVFAKPPHYHRSLYSKRAQEMLDEEENEDEILRTPSDCTPSVQCRIAGQDDVLNEELVGVKGASDVMRIYEASVGFNCSSWPDLAQEKFKRENRRVHVAQVDIELAKDQWNELVEELVGGRTLDKLLEEEKRTRQGTQNFSGSKPVLFNLDYFSRPPTPKTSRLNPSASSFVPLGSPTSTSSSSRISSASPDSFDRSTALFLPLLSNSVPPTTNSKNGYQGCILSAPSRSRPTSRTSCSGAGVDRPTDDYLPPFLLETYTQKRRPQRTSRTRAIVDQLRSQHHQDVVWSLPSSRDSSPTMPEFGVSNLSFFKPRLTVSEDGRAGSRSSVCSSSPPLIEEEQEWDERGPGGLSDSAGGWTFPPHSGPVDPEVKKNRSRELFMALRRRTNSLSSNVNSNVSLPTLGPRLLSVAPASTPSLILPARSAESPEPVLTVAAEKQIEVQEYEEDGWVGRAGVGNTYSLLQGFNPCTSPPPRLASPPSSKCSRSNAPSDTSPSPSPSATRLHFYANTHSPRDSPPRTQVNTKSVSISLGNMEYSPTTYLTNPTTGVPYALLSLPVSVPSLPMPVPSFPVPMTIPSRVTVPMPLAVQVPVQTMQYSTLMHLRIMQQMQMMRHSMGNTGLGVASARTQVGASYNPQ